MRRGFLHPGEDWVSFTHPDTKYEEDDSAEEDSGGGPQFPLRRRSKDRLLPRELADSREDLQTEYPTYVQLLQVASSPAPKNDFYGDLLPTSISADLVNQLDRTQGAAILHYACMNGHLPIVVFLLEHGAAAYISDRGKVVTPLICAAAHGNLKIVRLLLNYECDLNFGLGSQSSALFWAVGRNHPEVVQCLLDHGASQGSQVPATETVIHTAVTYGLPHILQILIRASMPKTNVELQVGSEKNTALHLAAGGKYPNSAEICKILIEQGQAKVNTINEEGQTPLHVAAASQQPNIVETILAQWAAVKAVDNKGRTPLFYALGDSENGIRCLHILITRGNSNVNHQDVHGYTALHKAGMEGFADAAEVLLKNGADFSIKSNNGLSALYFLRAKVPHLTLLLQRTFDQAVTVTHTGAGSVSESRKNTKIKVNFDYVLPSVNPRSSDIFFPSENPKSPTQRSSRFSRRRFRWGATESMLENQEKEMVPYVRKETSKIKCLVDEDQQALLLHPVIDSFLELKWKKARVIFLPIVAFNAVLVLLFSFYVLMPYLSSPQVLLVGDVEDVTTDNGTVTVDIQSKPSCYQGMYIVIVTMAVLKGIAEATHVVRAPKVQLRTVHPYISWVVIIIMIYYMSPGHWKKAGKPLERSMAALAILLTWTDVWIDMSRFPNVGLSIRVFLKVFHNFSRFMLPHICLLAGFVLAFTILFPGNGEFGSVALAAAKIIRVMAGDITIVEEGRITHPDARNETPLELVSYLLLVYIYTAYVLLVAIVLANMLVGLAANDIQAIFKDAAVNKLIKQTTLLNTLESNFGSKWIRQWIPNSFHGKYINLFEDSTQSKFFTVKPFDMRDSDLSSEQKAGLLEICNTKPLPEEARDLWESELGKAKMSRRLTPKKIRVWRDVVSKLRESKDSRSNSSSAHGGTEEDSQRLLMESISKLVAGYLEEKKANG